MYEDEAFLGEFDARVQEILPLRENVSLFTFVFVKLGLSHT